ncbi:MAG: nucleotidyltransferase domain-containing protein [Deltaproteobacteria bacterium]|nr:nucleotidyltransferase domain-containing protein [Deltaproteobacteria bacterium]
MVLKTSGLVDVLARALSTKEISYAFVFGSFAKQEDKSMSDVDLMVVGSIGLRKLTPLLREPSKRLDREINAHILTKSEFLKRKQSGEHFLAQVLAAPKIFIIGSENELDAMGR